MHFDRKRTRRRMNTRNKYVLSIAIPQNGKAWTNSIPIKARNSETGWNALQCKFELTFDKYVIILKRSCVDSEPFEFNRNMMTEKNCSESISSLEIYIVRNETVTTHSSYSLNCSYVCATDGRIFFKHTSTEGFWPMLTNDTQAEFRNILRIWISLLSMCISFSRRFNQSDHEYDHSPRGKGKTKLTTSNHIPHNLLEP